MTIHRWARWGNLGLALLLSLILLWLWWGLEGDVAQASTLKQGGPPILGEHCVDVGPPGLPLPPPDWCGCVWGTVYVNGQPQAGVTVTLAHADLTISFVTGVYTNWTGPHFALDGRSVGAVYGDWLTVTAVYSEQEVSRVYRAFPQTPTREQQVNLVFPEATGAPPTVLTAAATVTGTWLALSGAGADNDEGGAAILGYEWRSELDGVVAVSTTALLPLADLTPGPQTFTLRLQDDEGAWSVPLTRTAWVGIVTPRKSRSPVQRSASWMPFIPSAPRSARPRRPSPSPTLGKPPTRRRWSTSSRRSAIRNRSPGACRGSRRSGSRPPMPVAR